MRYVFGFVREIIACRTVHISLRSLHRVQYVRLLLLYSVIFQSVNFPIRHFPVLQIPVLQIPVLQIQLSPVNVYVGIEKLEMSRINAGS